MKVTLIKSNFVGPLVEGVLTYRPKFKVSKDGMWHTIIVLRKESLRIQLPTGMKKPVRVAIKNLPIYPGAEVIVESREGDLDGTFTSVHVPLAVSQDFLWVPEIRTWVLV